MKNVIRLVLVLTLSSLAFGFAGGTGTAYNPYQVSTVADLLAVNNDLDASYIMVNDINLAGTTYSHSLIAQAWYDSGALQGDAFGGTFNGNGYVIRNLIISDSNAAYVTGLFGVIGSGVVRNLGIIGVNVTGANAAGALVGKCYGTVSNCYASGDSGNGSVSSTSGGGTGGLIGTSGGGSVIEDSWAAIDVTAPLQAGGLVGQIRSMTTNCYATGDVEATQAGVVNYAGGFAGRQEEGSITDSYATGDVASNGHRYGGFVGFQNNSTTISRCYSTGSVTGTDANSIWGGGFVGQSDGPASLISHCYSTGNVYADTLNSQRIGGFAGQVINLFDSYATGSVTAHYGTGGLVGLAGLGNGQELAQIVRCYATGQVNGEVRPTAGLLAYNYASRVTVVDCFWDTQTSGTTVGIDYNNTGGATGKTTAEMKTKSTFTDAGWDFDSVWLMLTAATSGYPDYPKFSWAWQIGSYSVCDFNKDSFVNFEDFAAMASEWLSEASLVPVTQEGTPGAFIITHGPYLQQLREDAVTIMWTTSKNCISHVEWGILSTSENTTFSSHNGLIDANTTLHSIRLEGLQPGTTYKYRVVSKEILVLQPYYYLFGGTVTSGTYSFATLDPNKSIISFHTISDIHENTERLDWMLMNTGTANADFVIYNGDMINSYTWDGQLFDAFIDVSIEHFAHEKPFVFAMGNHEVRGCLSRDLNKYFLSPEGNFYYTFRHGPVHFTIMDSGEDKADDDDEYGGLVDFDNYRAQQLQWFQQQVSQTAEFQNADFRIVISHIPPYVNRGTPPDYYGVYSEVQIADNWLPAFNQAGVDLMLCGHLHQYMKIDTGEIANTFPIVVGSHVTVTQVDATSQMLSVTVKEYGNNVIDQFVVLN